MTSYRLSIVTFTERLANAVRNSYASQVTIQSYVYKRATAYTICLARYMLSPVRLSVRLSHGWISQKRLKIGS